MNLIWQSSFSDPLELSSVFNDHFSSIGLKLINAIQQNRDTPSYLDYVKETDHRFELKTTDCSKVFFLYYLNFVNLTRQD